ncbi:MAG: prolyl oligopeptidase family serine peptidase, partial [Candidatus Poribacteria bacterium]
MMAFLIIVTLTFSQVQTLPTNSIVWKVAESEFRGGFARTILEANPILLKLTEDPNFVPDWKDTATADENGIVKHNFFRNGWAYGEYESKEDMTAILEGNGFQYLFVNGERFAGDYYSNGILRIPIPLKKGVNRFIIKPTRISGFKIQLIPTTDQCSISPYDPILPDMREDTLIDRFGAVIILNHTDRVLKDVMLDVGDDKVFKKVKSNVVNLLPYGLAKPAFQLKQLRQPYMNELDENGLYRLAVSLNYGKTSQTVNLTMSIRKTGQSYKETKKSNIDGSVQYYQVLPPSNYDPNRSYSLYFTLHGAAVEATGQIGAYSQKSDGFVVAPTNRRPYGFDWQEWGRIDALETLNLFLADHNIDPERIYLTGHSMGGHGTWYLGALYPSMFSAIGPSAGWVSFTVYGRRGPSPELDDRLAPFRLADLENDTLKMVENYTNLPIYVIHGEKDDNVPVNQSRTMVAELTRFHKDFIYYEQPGAGHWWDDGSTPGAECVDWIPLFEFFRRHIRPLYPLSIKFKTPNQAISASYAWLTIYSQIRPSDMSSITADAEPRTGTVKISTDNVERLCLDLGKILHQNNAQILIDETTISAPTDKPVYLMRITDKGWIITDAPSPIIKSPYRSGPFKLAFDKNMVWVYGTNGSDEENEAMIAKARYDSQIWWYRGNGTVTIVSDQDFNPNKFEGRNIILYGNADTNSAFDKLLKNCPIKVNRNGIKVRDRLYQGDLGAFFLYPRTESDNNLVGVIGNTTIKALRMNFQA